MKIPFKLRLFLWYLSYFTRDYTHLPPHIVRKKSDREFQKAVNKIDFAPIEMHQVTNKEIAMRDGEMIPIRIFQPIDEEGLPLIVYFHGGGFVLRNIDSHDRVCRRIAHLNQAVVISVGYRLAPEWKFPVPCQDCYDATVWVAEHAAEIAGDLSRLVVMGDSAGGNLATVVSRWARDLNGPKITAQVLIYPTADARMGHPSMEKYAKGYLLTKDLIKWFIMHYANREADILHPDFSPLLAEDISNLPPAFIFTAEYDPLKDEAKAYAERLKAAGNKVVYKEYDGMIHAFFNLPKITKVALEAQKDIQTFLKQYLYEKSTLMSFT